MEKQKPYWYIGAVTNGIPVIISEQAYNGLPVEIKSRYQSLYTEDQVVESQEALKKLILGLMHDTARPLLRISAACVYTKRVCDNSNCASEVSDEYVPSIQAARKEIGTMLDNFYNNSKTQIK